MFAISILHIDKPAQNAGQPLFRPFVLPDREISRLPANIPAIDGAYMRLRTWLDKGWQGFMFNWTTVPSPDDMVENVRDWKKLMILGFPDDQEAAYERFSISGPVDILNTFEDPIVEYLEAHDYMNTIGAGSIKLAVRWERKRVLEAWHRRNLVVRRLQRNGPRRLN